MEIRRDLSCRLVRFVPASPQRPRQHDTPVFIGSLEVSGTFRRTRDQEHADGRGGLPTLRRRGVIATELEGDRTSRTAQSPPPTPSSTHCRPRPTPTPPHPAKRPQFLRRRVRATPFPESGSPPGGPPGAAPLRAARRGRPGERGPWRGRSPGACRQRPGWGSRRRVPPR